MKIENIVYKDYLIYPENVQLPDWVIKTMNENLEWITKSKDLGAKIKANGRELPGGKAALYNIAKDAKITYSELEKFLPVTKKTLKKLIDLIYKKVDGKTAAWITWMIQITGFYLNTKAPASYAASDFQLPDDIKKQRDQLVNDLNTGKIDEVEFQKKIEQLAKDLIARYEKEGKSISHIIDSGSAKNEISNIQRMLLARGLSLNNKGEVNAVVTKPLADGVSAKEYIATASEAIVSQYKKSKSTAMPGYLVRQLGELTTGIVVSHTEDCGTKDYLEITVLDDAMKKDIENLRFDPKGNLITSVKVGSKIKMRSPLFCKATDGLCKKCLGLSFEKQGIGPGDALFIVGSSIGDAATGSALKAAHSGLSLNKTPVDFREEVKNV